MIETLDPAALAANTVADLQPFASQRLITLRLFVPDPPPPITVDGEVLSLALTQLITHRLEVLYAGCVVRVDMAHLNNEIVIQVSDTGPGLPPDQLETLLTPLPHGGGDLIAPSDGPGLNLSVARRAAEQLGGGLVMEMTGRNGTVFALHVPVYQKTLAEELAEARAALELHHRQSMAYAHDLQALYRKLQAANRELQAANLQLQETNQLKANFLSIISHELRTPFVPLNTALQAFPRYGLDGLRPEQAELFEQITANAAHAYRKIDRLVKYADLLSKQSQLKIATVNLSALIADTVGAMTPFALRRRQRLITDVGPNLFMPAADPTLIGEALWQLLDNAIKFTPSGGQITVRAYQNEEYTALHVADTGPGIAPEYHAAIWKSFAQLSDALKRGEEGLGMGLALVQYVAEAHQGGVVLESALGQGSVFGVWIPLHMGSGERRG